MPDRSAGARRSDLAVAPVRDIDTSADWYATLLGKAPDARPMDSLADFHVTDGGWLQVFADPDRAGTTAVNFAVDDFDRTLADLRERGFDTSGAYGAGRGVRLLPITDPDGTRSPSSATSGSPDPDPGHLGSARTLARSRSLRGDTPRGADGQTVAGPVLVAATPGRPLGGSRGGLGEDSRGAAMTLPDVNHQVIAPADVYRAEGLLAGRLGLDVAAAAEVLQREAASREATVLDVAREVLSGDCSLGTTVLDPWGSC